MANKFKVKTPIGYLMVEAKGVEDEYPGVYVSFSKDGKDYDVSNMVACIEYDTGCEYEDEEDAQNGLLIETYMPVRDDPTHVIKWGDGEERY